MKLCSEDDLVLTPKLNILNRVEELLVKIDLRCYHPLLPVNQEHLLKTHMEDQYLKLILDNRLKRANFETREHPVNLIHLVLVVSDPVDILHV